MLGCDIILISFCSFVWTNINYGSATENLHSLCQACGGWGIPLTREQFFNNQAGFIAVGRDKGVWEVFYHLYFKLKMYSIITTLSLCMKWKWKSLSFYKYLWKNCVLNQVDPSLFTGVMFGCKKKMFYIGSSLSFESSKSNYI